MEKWPKREEREGETHQSSALSEYGKLDTRMDKKWKSLPLLTGPSSWFAGKGIGKFHLFLFRFASHEASFCPLVYTHTLKRPHPYKVAVSRTVAGKRGQEGYGSTFYYGIFCV